MFGIGPPAFARALLCMGVLLTPCFATQVFDFSYSLGPSPGYATTISGSGSLTTTDTLLPGGGYLIVSVTGTRTMTTPSQPTITNNITGLIPPGDFFGNSNLLYPSGPDYLDFDGFSFYIDNPFGGSNGTSEVNVYFDAFEGGYAEPTSATTYGSFTLTPRQTENVVPEPSSAILIGAGLTALSVLIRRRSRHPR